MGSGLSRFIGCFSRTGSDYPYGGAGVHFSEPLDEGLGHSFCYVRPPPLGSPTLVTPDKSEELNSGGKQGQMAAGVDETLADAAELLSSSKEEKVNLQGDKGRSSSVERPRHLFEKPKVVSKTFRETSFKAISGASVSANTATPRSVTSYEQFNSFSNVIFDRAAAFESTSSFAAVPLQPIPKGFSGPLSGPLDRGLDKGFMSGPLERGFMSGPLERGFMSGPLERGFMSGPLDGSGDRTHFSAPLNGRYHEPGYWKRKKSFARFMTNVGRPMKNAFARTASTIAKKHRTFVIPVMNLINKDFIRDSNSIGNASAADQDKRGPGPRRRGVDSNDPSIEFSSELDVKESDNLQWAQGKAGEDRVHVVISEEQGWIFVGIYDGFNGPDAPDFLMSNLYPAVSQELQGLLWDPKVVQPSSASVHYGKEIEEDFVEPEAEVDGHAGGENHARGEIGCGRRTQRPRGDMIEMGDVHHGGLGVVVVAQELGQSRDGLGTIGRKSPADVGGPREHNVPAESLDEGNRDQDGDETLEPEEGISNSIDDDLESGAQKDRDESVPSGVIGGEDGKRDSAANPKGKVEEDSVAGEESEIESERPSDRPEILETSAFSCRDYKRKKKRVRPGLKFRHGDRRKEHKQKYCQWNYDLDQENPGVVQKVKNAKVSQDPDNVHQNTGAEHANVLKALARALEATENAYLDMADKVLFDNPELALMGSCVLVMLMKDEDVYILNVGDSRAILAQHPKVESVNTGLGSGGRNGRNGNEAGTRHSLLRQELERIIEETPMELEALEAAHENGTVGGESPVETTILGALQLTKDHSTNIKEEVSRLRAEHPDEDIIENDRVKGKLKVTRAFGAGYLKQPKWNDALLEMFQIKFIGTAPYMTCSPALYHHKLGPRDEFLILSSDGLYQYFSNDEVVSHVESFMKTFPDGDPAQHLIEELLFRAAKKAGLDFHELLDIPQGDRRKYHDDVSVMVISLEGRIWRSSG